MLSASSVHEKAKEEFHGPGGDAHGGGRERSEANGLTDEQRT